MASFFQNLFGTTANITDPSVVKTYNNAGILSWFGFGTGTASRPTQESALETTAVLSCVKVISEGVASLPVRLMKKEIKNGKVITRVAHDHWAHKLLAVKPNSYMTSYELTEFLIVNALLGRGALLLKVKVGDQVRELHPVVDGAWSVEILSDQSTQFRVTFANGTQQIFRESDVVFFKGMSLDGRIGIDVLDKARVAVGINSSLERQHLNTSTNMGRPSGVLSFAEPLDSDRKAALRNSWQEKFGPGGAGGVAILDGTATYQQMSLSLVDSQFIESRKHQINEICRIFRVSPHMVMHSDNAATFASVESHNRNHYQHCLNPWVTRLEQVLHKSILNHSADYYFDYDETLLLRGSHKDMMDYLSKALGSGGTPAILTVNEARLELGYDASDDPNADILHTGGYNQPSTQPVADE